MIAETRSPAARRWALFWDDQQAVRLKIVVLVCCLLAAALLEVPR
jgi:hypothetical protein